MTPPFSVLACLDLTHETTPVLSTAAQWAEATGSTLHVVVAGQRRGDKISLATDQGLVALNLTAAQADVQLQLVRAAEQLGHPKLADAHVHIAVGSPAQAIVRTAAQLDCAFIVVGTHSRRGAKRLMLGSVAEAVVRQAGCSVIVARPQAHEQAVAALGDETQGGVIPTDILI